MAELKTMPNLDRTDDVYQALIDAQETLAPEDGERFRARLILLLANQVGDADVVLQAIAAAGVNLERTRDA